MKRQFRLFILVLLLLAGSVQQGAAARTPLKITPLFGNGMVLQRNIGIPVWGTAAAGTAVSVSFQNPSINQSFSTTAAADGKWMVQLNSMSASAQPGSLLVQGGGSSITVTDILVGDVWVLSGQSNVTFKLKESAGGAAAISGSGSYPTIRMYLIPASGDLPQKWQQSNSKNTPGWSAVGFFFARALHNLIVVDHQMDVVPIGLIQVAKGGTPIADWTTYGNVANGRLYRDRIRPLQPFGIRGVLWYQGEDDGEEEASALQYYEMLPGLIENWRADWGQGEFPFNYVQLPPIANKPNWPIIRDAQVSTLDVTSNTAMASIIDVPTVPADEIHPVDKEPAGKRLALAAFVQTYPQTNVLYAGPVRNGTQSVVLADSIVVKFDFAEAGLVTDDGLDPGPFLIAGADGVYYPATTTLAVTGDSVVVSNPSSVPTPISVRYCWESYPQCNLFNDMDDDPGNGYGLPASPFQLTLQ